MKQVTKNQKPLQAPDKAQRNHDEKRMKHCDDERLSKDAGYGRAESTPNSKQ
jgi:hypothetical protein